GGVGVCSDRARGRSAGARWGGVGGGGGRGAPAGGGAVVGPPPPVGRARHWKGRIEVLLELGADVNHGENDRGTPLHAAAGSCNAVAAGLLLQHGARVDALNRERQTPLAFALQRCSNAQIAGMAALAEGLLAAGARAA